MRNVHRYVLTILGAIFDLQTSVTIVHVIEQLDKY